MAEQRRIGIDETDLGSPVIVLYENLLSVLTVPA